MSPVYYRKLEDLSPQDIALLRQAYQRLFAEGYDVAWGFSDFLDMVLGRGTHEFNEFYEMESIDRMRRKIEVEFK